jgi:hypothetical protein
MLQLIAILLAVGSAAFASAEEAPALVCRGHDTQWNLRIDGEKASLATLGSGGIEQTSFEGRLAQTPGRPRSFVYRGRAASSASDLVAMISEEACVDTTAEASGSGGRQSFTARVSLPDGALRLGCCSIAEPPAAHAGEEPPQPGTASASTDRGEITALTLSDNTECRPPAAGTELRFRGQRVPFDCGRSGGDTLALVGPLTPGPEGLLVAQKVFVPWRSSDQDTRPREAVPVRATEITLATGLACRFAGTRATLAFAGRRLAYSCGTKDGDTVALLGELEPAEGGFRILLAKVAHGESGFTVRSSEPILVSVPR